MGVNRSIKLGGNLVKVSFIIFFISFWVGSFSFVPLPILLDENYQYDDPLTWKQYRDILEYHNDINQVSALLYTIGLLIGLLGIFFHHKDLSRDIDKQMAERAWLATISYLFIALIILPFVLYIMGYLFYEEVVPYPRIVPPVL